MAQFLNNTNHKKENSKDNSMETFIIVAYCTTYNTRKKLGIDDIAPEIGQQIKINDKQLAEPLIVTITSVTDTEVTLDANHPLAGKDLTFDIELVAING